jgi:hypothetical protein
MPIIFIFGICLTVFAPLLRRSNLGNLALAGGAMAVIGMAVFGLTRLDPRYGLAAIEADRREYIFLLICEAPVFLLALVSWKGGRWAFWVGWGINMVLALIVLAVIIDLKYFWHW